MYIPRLLERSLTQALRSFPAVFVGGPRRAGKTMLVTHLLADYEYVLLDELNVRAFAAQDPQAFLDRYRAPVVIDEIQHVPSLLSYLKARIDRQRGAGRWVLTGSQQWTLMRGMSETLAGRIAVLHLYPFSIAEIQRRQVTGVKSAAEYVREWEHASSAPRARAPLGDWLLRGGYPEVALGTRQMRSLWCSSYLQTYIDRDIRGNVREANLRDFERCVRLLAARTAQELNISTLARDVGVTVPTIKAWLTLLEAGGLIVLIMPYHVNLGKRLVKAPKCYFLDTGLVCYLVGLKDSDHALQGPMGGALFETWCVAEVYKRLTVWGEERSLYYFRSSDGMEIDLILELGSRCYPIEIKLSSTIDPARLRNLTKWRALRGHRHTTGFVISTAPSTDTVAAGVRNVPFFLL